MVFKDEKKEHDNSNAVKASNVEKIEAKRVSAAAKREEGKSRLQQKRQSRPAILATGQIQTTQFK